MPESSIPIRCTSETYKKLNAKKVAIEKRFTELTGKQKKLPYTTIVTVMVGRPIRLTDQEILRLVFRNKKQRRIKLL